MKINLFILASLALLIGCEIITPYYPDLPPDPILYSDGDSTVLSAKSHDNDYACVVTALGIWLQFWDNQGYELMDDYEDIVSTQHKEYYAKPKDTQANLLPDSSILENPPQNCLADFMKTSWYANRCSHGMTVGWNALLGIEDYLKYKGDNYTVSYEKFKDWDSYIRVIDQGRPAYLIVGIGNGTHALLGVGYTKSDSSYLVYESFGGNLKKHMWNAKTLDEDWIMIIGRDLKLKYRMEQLAN